jgi:hypothetical protein
LQKDYCRKFRQRDGEDDAALVEIPERAGGPKIKTTLYSHHKKRLGV